MPTRRIYPPPAPRQWQSLTSRIRSMLRTRGLEGVLDSLPSATSFDFYECVLLKKKAVRFHIGTRAQSDNTQARSWAYILLDLSDIDPPVPFHDEMPATLSNNAQSKLYPRAATSLVRNAGRLSSPLCFLQVDSDDNATSIRSMICSLVAYYSLASGLSNFAVKWSRFEGSFIQALEYIDSRAQYQRRIAAQVEDSDATLDSHMSNAEDIAIEVNEGIQDATDDVSRTETWAGNPIKRIIHSIGSSVSIKSGSTLARFKDAMGEKFSLLDAIPPVPITIERQAIFDNYFPFRLYIGVCNGTKVYVYPTHDNKGTMKILAHGSESEPSSWTFFDLSQIELVEPFNFLMHHGNNDLRTRGNKIRYLIHYYLMLAENTGMMGDARVQEKSPSMVASFCSACRDLKTFGRSESKNVALLESAETGETLVNKRSSFVATKHGNKAHDAREVTAPSLVVKLAIRPDILVAISGISMPSYCTVVFDNDDEQAKAITGDQLKARQHWPHFAIGEKTRSQEISYPDERAEQPPEYAEDTVMEVIQHSNCNGQEADKYPFRNSETTSPFPPSAAPVTNRSAPSRMSPILDITYYSRLRSATVRIAQDNSKPHSNLPPDMSPDVEDQGMRVRSVSSSSFDSNGEVQGRNEEIRPAYAALANKLFPPLNVVRPPRGTVIIDLGSESEESVIAESPKREIEETPDVDEVLSLNQQVLVVSDDDELRLPPKRGVKQNMHIVSDDNMFEEVDGDAWRRASRIKQPASSDETWRN